MPRRLAPVLALALAALLAAPAAWPRSAAAVSCGPCPATTTADLNLRAGPSTAHQVLRVIPAGAQVEWDPFQAQTNGFVAVAYAGTAGWSHRDFLLLFPAFATTTTSLNLRDGPSLGARVLEVLPPGAAVQVLGGPENGFYSVRYQERVAGWCHGDYLAFSGGSPDPGPGPGGATATVSVDLNLREGPGLGHRVLLVMPAGSTVVLLATQPQDGFVPVAFGETTGWAFAAYLA
jgi:uncharacterized protein YraI